MARHGLELLRRKSCTKGSMRPRFIQDLAHFKGWGEEQSSKSVHQGEPLLELGVSLRNGPTLAI